jgi:UDP-N-acetylglucosamine--N-acetylmuramyl-(pentapeptide) pyrophosphoryl-undecaprenol N-acetylglucosamine transferase
MMARIAIACGGTGGHLFPGLAVAQECVRRGHEVRLYVSSKEIDRSVMKNYPEFDAVALPTVGWTGLNFRALIFLKKLWEGYRLAKSELRDYKPDAVLGMGGFTSAPLILTACRKKLPSLIHESNAIPGKVTRWLAPKVNRVLIGFSECGQHLPRAQTRVTGTPVRTSLAHVSRAEAASLFNLEPGKFTIAIMGGSQGALGLNDMVIRCLPEWEELKDKIQFIHLTGTKDNDLTLANYRRHGFGAEVMPFCDRMEMVYSLADLAISRSGASSLAEIAHYGLPSILIPYPHAAEDHQTRNAEVFVRAAAALLIPQRVGNVPNLVEAVRDLSTRPEVRQEMANCARTMTGRDATRRIAEELEALLA